MTEIVQGPRPNGLHTVAAEDDAKTIADLHKRVSALEQRAAALELAVLLVQNSICGRAATEGAQPAGTGECELLDTDIGGLAVHIAARILGNAGAGEILVSRTVRDPVVGSGTGFEDRGSVELRGVPGTWQLSAVDRHGPPAGSAEAELASTPTPGPRTAMRRSDRAVAVMARRTPWILRGMARLAPATGRR